MKYILALLLLTSCTSMRTGYVIVKEQDLPKLKDCQSITEMQDAVAFNTMDLGQALLMSSFAGVGLSMYESRVFYAGRSFPTEQGSAWDWYRQPHSGDSWLKIGDSDKLFRSLWTSTSRHANVYWSRYFGGMWWLVYLADFIVSNTVATFIRSYAKHGEVQLNIDISLPHF
jgi:hypothetical protein